MILVSGKLFIAPGKREKFLASSREAITQARLTPGCRDFIVAADPIEKDRVNIYEEWETEAQLEIFRGTGPDDGLTELIVKAEISQRKVPEVAS